MPDSDCPRHALTLGDDQIHREDHRRRRVDRHRRRDVAERNAIEQRFHVGQRRDRDAALADFAQRRARGPDRGPSASAGRTRRSGRCRRPRAGGGIAGSWTRASRIPRTAASSRACPGSRWRGCRACKGMRRDPRDRARSRAPAMFRGAIDRVDGPQRDRAKGAGALRSGRVLWASADGHARVQYTPPSAAG